MVKGGKNFRNLSSPQDSVCPLAYLHKRQRAVPCRLLQRCFPAAALLPIGLCSYFCHLDHVYHAGKSWCGTEPPRCIACWVHACHYSYCFSFLLRKVFKSAPKFYTGIMLGWKQLVTSGEKNTATKNKSKWGILLQYWGISTLRGYSCKWILCLFCQGTQINSTWRNMNQQS